VERFYDAGAAAAAEAAFDRVFIRGQIPQDVPVVRWTLNGSTTVHLPALLAHAFSVSTSEARRGLAQGAVRLDGEPVDPGVLDLPAGDLDGRVLQMGKRRFARVETVA
jgi:tyrosyl-tRNA synthetase